MEHTHILRAAVAGNDEALTVLVRTYHARVYRFGRRVCRDHFDAEDAVQEAFIKLSRRPDVQSDVTVLSWLLSVVRHACLRLMRPFLRQQRPALAALNSDDELVSSEEMSPEKLLECWQLVDGVHRAIASLPPDSRQVLILRDIEGLSGSEVSSMLDISEAAMKTRLHRARSMLRDRIESDAPPYTLDRRR
jgi:RNA polymerase sigma-70 factor, ECF subfamily